MIQVELKDEAIPGLPTRPLPFGRDELDGVDREILSVFAPTEILTPDRVRGQFVDPARGHPHSRLAGSRARSGDWSCSPSITRAPVRDRYLEGHPALRDRVMFASVAPEDPAAAWFKINDPIKDFDRIQRLVREGFLVRTRADADTRQARANDVTQRDKALASGAQFISTDYRRARSPVLRLFGTIPRPAGRAIQPGERRPGLDPDRPGKRKARFGITVFAGSLARETAARLISSEAASSHAVSACLPPWLVATKTAKFGSGASQIETYQLVLRPVVIQGEPAGP